MSSYENYVFYSVNSKQIQTEVEPFSWSFPKEPVDLVKKPPVEFEVQQPARPDRVAVRCGESTIRVEVSQDLLGRGRLIRPEDLTLGGCSATEVDDSSHVLSFNYELHSCGSTLTMTENAFVYAFMLLYNPKASGRSDITRHQSAVIGVECHYRMTENAFVYAFMLLYNPKESGRSDITRHQSAVVYVSRVL